MLLNIKGGFMKRSIIYVIIITCILIFIQVVYGNDNSNEKIIQIVNKTKFDLISIQISPSEKKHYSENILVKGIFKKDEKKEIRLTPADPTICKYDIKATKVNGDSIIFKGADLCHLLNITLYFEDNQAYLKQNIIIENLTGFTIDELYVSQANINFWSANVLGTIALNDGNKSYISFIPAKKECLYDLKIRRLNGSKIIYPDINMCKTYKVTLYWGEGRPYIWFYGY